MAAFGFHSQIDNNKPTACNLHKRLPVQATSGFKRDLFVIQSIFQTACDRAAHAGFENPTDRVFGR